MMSIFQNLKTFIVHIDKDARHQHSIARKKWEAAWVMRRVQIQDLKMSVEKLKVDERINMDKLKKQITLDDIVV